MIKASKFMALVFALTMLTGLAHAISVGDPNVTIPGTLNVTGDIGTSGKVGMGTTTPQDALHIWTNFPGADQYAGIRFKPCFQTYGVYQYHLVTGFRGKGLGLAGSAQGHAYWLSYFLLDDDGFSFTTSPDGYQVPITKVKILNNGYMGIGTLTPTTRLHVAGDIRTTGTMTGVTANFSGNVSAVNGRFSGNVGIGTTSPASLLDVAGEASVNVINIRGGSDVAERFDISGKNVQPGTVVCIDPANPGKLVVSNRAYDRTIAGIVSGANGLSTGLTLSDKSTPMAHGQYPVALTGRVYCQADASNGAIMPGDLLTTSAVPGHAMKVSNHAKAQGAILGKAMTPLAKGEKGLVLVLVSLQ